MSVYIIALNLWMMLCIADPVVKQAGSEIKGDICTISKLREQFDINVAKFVTENYDNQQAKCMEFKLVDKRTEHKFQIYENVFTINDCNKILEKAKYPLLPLPKFTDLIMYCLSEENTLHQVNVNVINGQNLEINIKYTPDKFTEFKFILTVPAKEMNEIDLLKLRLNEFESNTPILFYEKLQASRKRSKGWHIINLDHFRGDNSKYIQHNKQKGSIKVQPGKYMIEAEGTAHYVEKHIIQI
eukprot:420562_1